MVSCQWNLREIHPLKLPEYRPPWVWGSCSKRQCLMEEHFPAKTTQKSCQKEPVVTGCPWHCRSLALNKERRNRSRKVTAAAGGAVPSHKVLPTPCTDKAKPQTSRQRKSRKRPRRRFTKKAKRVNLELTGHESVTGILCNLSKVQAFSGFPSPNMPARSR